MRHEKIRETRELLGELMSEAEVLLGDEVIEIDDNTLRYLIGHAETMKGKTFKTSDGSEVKLKSPVRRVYRKDIENYVANLGYPTNAPLVARIISTATDNQSMAFSPENIDDKFEMKQEAKFTVEQILRMRFSSGGSLGKIAIDTLPKDRGDVGKGEILFAMLTGLKREGGEKTDVGAYSVKFFGEGGSKAAKLGSSYSSVAENVRNAMKEWFQEVVRQFENQQSNLSRGESSSTIDTLIESSIPRAGERSFSAGLKASKSSKGDGTDGDPDAGGYRLLDSVKSFLVSMQNTFKVPVSKVYARSDALAQSLDDMLNKLPEVVIGDTPTIGLQQDGGTLSFKLYSSSQLKFDSLTEGRLKISPVASGKYREAVRKAYMESLDSYVDQGEQPGVASLTYLKSLNSKELDEEIISMNADELKKTLTALNVPFKSKLATRELEDLLRSKLNPSPAPPESAQSSNESRTRGSSRKRKREFSGAGAIAGVVTPLGTGPDGRPTGRSKKSVLRKNAKTQGKSFGGAKPVNEVSNSLSMVKTSFYMSGEGGGYDVDADGDIQGYEKGMDTASAYRGGGGDLRKHAKISGRAFANAEPITSKHKGLRQESVEETRDLLWELFEFESNT